jgi:hypothetical protein
MPAKLKIYRNKQPESVSRVVLGLLGLPPHVYQVDFYVFASTKEEAAQIVMRYARIRGPQDLRMAGRSKVALALEAKRVPAAGSMVKAAYFVQATPYAGCRVVGSLGREGSKPWVAGKLSGGQMPRDPYVIVRADEVRRISANEGQLGVELVMAGWGNTSHQVAIYDTVVLDELIDKLGEAQRIIKREQGDHG